MSTYISLPMSVLLKDDNSDIIQMHAYIVDMFFDITREIIQLKWGDIGSGGTCGYLVVNSSILPWVC